MEGSHGGERGRNESNSTCPGQVAQLVRASPCYAEVVGSVPG